MLNNKKAFTLVEVLLASAIFAILAVGLYSLFYSAIRNYQKIEDSSEIYNTQRLVFSQIQRDLRNAFIYKTGDSGFIGSSNKLDFYTITNAYKNSTLYREAAQIEYAFNNNALTRQILTKENAQSSFSSQVKDLSFEYARKSDDPKASSAYVWQEVWPVEAPQDISLQQKARLPLALRVKIFISLDKAKNTDTVAFTKVIPLFCDVNEK
ncbi:MAG: prepilin-type N-terminal cleavage/methylation domain-containing protein [Candidatus Omnitrophica bacterium]|jgi:prepilin-type N-terminal cleavage/methylation domain-containing protein|nr:prepilin-type N-terminal cleavage/methylation domain-containing protein [Candidatus Omnitrophota bacterium]